MTSHITIHTDGAWSGKGPTTSRGGWAAVLEGQPGQLRIGGNVPGHATLNQMKLTAVIKALEAVRNPQATVTVYTDSEYVQKGCESLEERKLAGWRLKSNGARVQNLDLWKLMDVQMQRLADLSVLWSARRNRGDLGELAWTLAVHAREGKPFRVRRLSGDVSVGGI